MSVIDVRNFSVKSLALFDNRELIPKRSLMSGVKVGNASFGVLTLLLIRELIGKRNAMTGLSEESHWSHLLIRHQRNQSVKNYHAYHHDGIHNMQNSHNREHQRMNSLTLQRHSVSYR